MDTVKHPLICRELDRINMDVISAAYVTLDKNWCSHNAIAQFTRFYFVTKGKGYVKYGENTTELLPGNIYVLPSDTNFSYWCEDDFEKLYFHIVIPKMNNYDIFNAIKECVVIKNQMPLIQKAIMYFQSSDIKSALKLKTILYEISVNAISQSNCNFGEIESYSEPVKAAIRYIADNPHMSVTTNQVADAAMVSVSKLQKLFRAELGVSVNHYINDRILAVAERKLLKTDYPLKTISDSLGFCDQFYFSRLFSERYGIPPMRYRKRYQ